jgi:hypothetical protein
LPALSSFCLSMPRSKPDFSKATGGPGWLVGQTGNYPETGLWEALNSVSKALTRVNSLGPNPRIVIALRSPSALAETGLPLCLAEKCQTFSAFATGQSVLCSPVYLGLIAKYGHYSGTWVEIKRDFSAVKTEWRRGRDSLPPRFLIRRKLLILHSRRYHASRPSLI